MVIAEDNFSVAQGLQFLLERFGCEVVGMAGTVPTVFDVIAEQLFDLVVLDIDLRGESTAQVAYSLRQRGIPFFFLSGYSDEALLPPDLRSVPRLGKPVDPDVLKSTIRDVLDRRGS